MQCLRGFLTTGSIYILGSVLLFVVPEIETMKRVIALWFWGKIRRLRDACGSKKKKILQKKM